MNMPPSALWPPGAPLARPGDQEGPAPGVLDNPRSGRVARVAALARRQARIKHGRFLVEGPQGVREAVRCAPGHVSDLYLTPRAGEHHTDILAMARAHRLHTHVVTERVMAAMSGDAQGLLAVVRAAALAEGIEEAPDRPTGVRPRQSGGIRRSDGAGGLAERLGAARLVAVLAQAQDPGNTGTIIRTADAAGADAVVLLPGSVEATNPKVVRSTAGSLFHLPILTGHDPQEVFTALREAGLAILAADGRGQTGLFESESLLRRPTAWVFGNEAHGLDAQVLGIADCVISIPMIGAAESLNVATAAAVCLYASARAHR